MKAVNPQTIDILPLNRILAPLDQLLLGDITTNNEFCSTWNTTVTTCVDQHVEDCDVKVKEQVKTLKSLIGQVCSQFVNEVLTAKFKGKKPCLLGINVRNRTQEVCLEKLKNSLHSIAMHRECAAENDTICDVKVQQFPARMLEQGERIVIGENDTHHDRGIIPQLCRAVDDSIECYSGITSSICQRPSASENEHRIRKQLENWYLADLDCANIDAGNSCPIGQFSCQNGSCILGSLRCDGVDNCSNGEDEWRCDQSSTSTFAIVAIVMVALLVVVVGIVCVVKVMQERKDQHMYLTDHDSEEMLDVLRREELPIGQSTPPLNANYKAADDNCDFEINT